MSGNSTGSALRIVEVTAGSSTVVSDSARLNLDSVALPDNRDRHERWFLCELWAANNVKLTESESAMLVIIRRGADLAI